MTQETQFLMIKGSDARNVLASDLETFLADGWTAFSVSYVDPDASDTESLLLMAKDTDAIYIRPSDYSAYSAQGYHDVKMLYGAGRTLVTQDDRINFFDSIGDGLRADLKAYWNFNEASGTRADSTANDNDLTDVNSNVGSTTGKNGNAAQFTGTATKVLRMDSNANISIDPELPFYLFAWVKLNLAQIAGGGITLFDKGSDDLGEREYWLYYYDGDSKLHASNYNGNEAVTEVVEDATWYFLEFIYNPSLGDFGQFGIAINNGAFSMADLYEGGVSTFEHPLHVGNDDDDNYIGAGLIDASGILHRLPADYERTYLYNSGNGQALY